MDYFNAVIPTLTGTQGVSASKPSHKVKIGLFVLQLYCCSEIKKKKTPDPVVQSSRVAVVVLLPLCLFLLLPFPPNNTARSEHPPPGGRSCRTDPGDLQEDYEGEGEGGRRKWLLPAELGAAR